LQLNEAGNAIVDVKFDGVGCDRYGFCRPDGRYFGKSVNEALSMVQRFQSMMKGEDEFPKSYGS